MQCNPLGIIPAETRRLIQSDSDALKNVFSRAWQVIRSQKNFWSWYFTLVPGRPCGADFFYNIWHLGSHRWRNQPYQISSRLR